MIEPRELREQIDLYLDNALDTAARAEFEKALNADTTAAFLLAQVKAERGLRTAALNTYLPSTEDAARFSSETLIACRDQELAPVGRIAPARPLTRWLAVAAAIAVCAGSFAFGRMTAPTAETKFVDRPVITPEINLVMADSNGIPQEVQQFSSAEALADYLQSRAASAQTSTRGIFNASYNTSSIDEHGKL